MDEIGTFKLSIAGHRAFKMGKDIWRGGVALNLIGIILANQDGAADGRRDPSLSANMIRFRSDVSYRIGSRCNG